MQAKAWDSLLLFFEASAQIEIDEFRDYHKALQVACPPPPLQDLATMSIRQQPLHGVKISHVSIQLLCVVMHAWTTLLHASHMLFIRFVQICFFHIHSLCVKSACNYIHVCVLNFVYLTHII